MVVTVGFFDGVHLGHRRVLRSLSKEGDRAAVVTFWPHPRVVLQKDADGLSFLSSIEEKTQMLHACGVDNVECVNFNPQIASMTAEEFIREYLVRKMGCDSLVLGYDNRLGSDGLSTVEIAQLGRSMGLDVEIQPPVCVDDIPVSSTRIRDCITRDGDVSLASRMLGYRYGLNGVVVPGNKIGRTIGFPTANIAPSYPLKSIPKNGVYATEVIIDGNSYKGMTNIGVRPTVKQNGERVIETNIFDFNQDIYGREIRLNFMERIRSEQIFPNLDALKNQLLTDKHRCYGCN